jgi:hypothetical protein
MQAGTCKGPLMDRNIYYIVCCYSCSAAAQLLLMLSHSSMLTCLAAPAVKADTF